MNKIVIDVKEKLELNSKEFDIFLNNLEKEKTSIRYNYYKHLRCLYVYNNIDITKENAPISKELEMQYLEAVPALFRMLKSEQILSDLLISEWNLEKFMLYDHDYKNWYECGLEEEFVWSPTLFTDTNLFEFIEGLFPSEILIEFKFSYLKNIRKALSVKLGKNFSTTAKLSHYIVFNGKAYSTHWKKLDDCYFFGDTTNKVLYFCDPGDPGNIDSVTKEVPPIYARPTPEMYFTRYIDFEGHERNTYLSKTLKKINVDYTYE